VRRSDLVLVSHITAVSENDSWESWSMTELTERVTLFIELQLFWGSHGCNWKCIIISFLSRQHNTNYSVPVLFSFVLCINGT